MSGKLIFPNTAGVVKRGSDFRERPSFVHCFALLHTRPSGVKEEVMSSMEGASPAFIAFIEECKQQSRKTAPEGTRTGAELVAFSTTELQTLDASRPTPINRTAADQARAWRAKQPKRGRKRRDWQWEQDGVRYFPLRSREARHRLMVRVRAYNHATKVAGEHKGFLKGIGEEVMAALIHFSNRNTGECTPSLQRIAEHIGRARSSVQDAIARLADAKLLYIVPRRGRGRRRDGRVLPCVISNAYVFPPDTEIRAGTGADLFKTPKLRPNDAASAWSAELRSPAATAPSPIYLPDGVEPPF